MEPGKILKSYREENQMSQEETAKSIVSSSYLSRIENGQTKADDTTLALLFERLGVDYYDIRSRDEELENLLTEWETPLLHNDFENSQVIHEKINELVFPFSDTKLQVEYHIKKIRFSIICNELNSTEPSFRFINKFDDTLSQKNRFYYYKYKGNYCWAVSDVENAYQVFSPAILGELEKADLYFLYALALYANQQETVSFKLAQEALNIFQDNYRVKERLKLHIHLGICYSKLGDMDSSLSQFKKAEYLSKEIDENSFNGIVQHNIGYAFFCKKQRSTAIYHLQEALAFKKQESYSYLHTLNFLIYTNLIEGYIDKCMVTINDYLEIVSNSSEKQIQVKEFWFLVYFIKEPQYTWEKQFNEVLLPTLKEEGKYQELIKYSKLLAAYYENQGSYKKSSCFYKIALDNSSGHIY